MAGDLVEVVLVSLWSNNVDDLVEGYTWILFPVLSSVVAKNLIVRDLRETHLRQALQLPFPQLMLTQLFARLWVSFKQLRIHISRHRGRRDCLFVEVLLCRDFDVFSEGRLAHSR